MPKPLFSAAQFVLLSMMTFIPFTAGCGSSGGPTADNSDSASDLPPQSTTVGQASGGNVSDPFAPAKQTVAVFLDCLRRGDEATANSMLTSKARQELQKTAWVMQPLGTPEGRYEIGRAGLPYPDQKVVLVESRWQEPSVPNQPDMAMDIVCELYEEQEGWRIAGIAVTMVGDEEALVIDFEDGARLQQMLDLANGIGAPENGGSQNLDQATQPGTNLPAFPDFPSNAEPPQVAQPPNSGSFLR